MLSVDDVWEGLGDGLIAASGPSIAPETPRFERGVIDSREAKGGDLFFALRGESADGHDFVGAAIESGASGAVVARPVEAPAGTSVFQVQDPLTGLQELAASWRRKHKTQVIGVTGSVGKTTAKELIASVLGTRYNVLKSEANLNTEIGIPLALLNLRPQHERAVLELGMYEPGDIALLARISRPSVGVVTNVGPVHMERALSVGRIAAGKAELVQALPADGLAVLNGDDARVTAMARLTSARTVLFGMSPQCDVRATDVTSRGLDGFSFHLHYAGGTITVDCPLPGKHHVYPALAAAAVALNDDLTLADVATALREATLDMRLTARRGPNGSTIIDDSYNASPASMLAALDLLGECSGRRIAVLGHMRELGTAEEEGHLRVGMHAAGRCDVLITVGEDARPIAQAARQAGHTDVREIATPEEAAAALNGELKAEDVCLVKASRAVGLEQLVAALVAR